MTQPLETLILAAGQGTRMRSALPKVLHPIGGRPMLEHVVDAAGALGPGTVRVVYGHGGEQVPERLAHLGANWVEQAEQLGTGHAVAQALPEVADDARVLILYGDVPLIRPETLQGLLDAAGSGLALLTVELSDPAGYGRVLRDADGRVTAIVEHKDATAAERAVREINTGLLAVDAGLLKRWVARLDNDNRQGEYYLTDIFAMAREDGVAIGTAAPADPDEVQGINDRVQLAAAERVFQRRQAEALMREGVTVADPARLDLRGRVTAARDAFLDVGVVLEGDVVLGEGARVGAHSVIRDSELAEGAEVREHSVVEGAVVGPGCQVGPFARLRPGTRLAHGARVGNFVEIKKSAVGEGSKVNHLAYIGDTEMGSGVNVGAGTITCNYDGANKHRTVIGDGAFIGSDTQLVAPVEVGADATIGAGSTITREAPAGKLTLSRSKQQTVDGWQRPKKKL